MNSAGRSLLALLVVASLAILAQSCAHQGDPFVPVHPGTPESTKVEGYEDGRWIRKNSPYYVMKSVIVARTRTLTIEPGVTVVFTEDDQTLTVQGRLVVAGKPESLVTFRPTRPQVGDYTPGSWWGLVLQSRDNDIRYARVHWATIGIELADASATLDGIEVKYAFRDGIVASRSDLTLRNSTLASNGRRGLKLVSCEDPIYKVVVEHCNIGNNRYAGIWSSYSSALITRSDIKGNGTQLGVEPDSCCGAHFEGTPGVKLPVFHMCNIEQNVPCDIRNMMLQDLVVTADSTYWGLTTTAEMGIDKATCDFNVRKICDAQDFGSGAVTVHFCWWRDEAWPNFPSSPFSPGPGTTPWTSLSPRWR